MTTSIFDATKENMSEKYTQVSVSILSLVKDRFTIKKMFEAPLKIPIWEVTRKKVKHKYTRIC